MRILDFYIARVVISGAVLALTVLTALDVFFALIDEFEDVGSGTYGYGDALFYIVLTLPRRIYELFPAAVLVGSLLSLGVMASNSELIVMRAAGISVARIVGSAAQAGIVLMLFVILVGEFLVPLAERYAQTVQSRKQGLQVSQVDENGIWIREGDRFIHVEKIYPDLHLQDVYIYKFDQNSNLSSATHAGSVIQQSGFWELRDIMRTRFKGGQITRELREVEYWPTLLNADMFNILRIKPETMSAYALNKYVTYLKENNLDTAIYRLAFWLKIVTPISCVVMLLLVMPFVFGALRSVGAGLLVVVGILLGLSFYILIQIASQVGQIYGIPPFISATFPVICFSVIGLVGLAKIK